MPHNFTAWVRTIMNTYRTVPGYRTYLIKLFKLKDTGTVYGTVSDAMAKLFGGTQHWEAAYMYVAKLVGKVAPAMYSRTPVSRLCPDRPNFRRNAITESCTVNQSLGSPVAG
jgi:hypothetical protein